MSLQMATEMQGYQGTTWGNRVLSVVLSLAMVLGGTPLQAGAQDATARPSASEAPAGETPVAPEASEARPTQGETSSPGEPASSGAASISQGDPTAKAADASSEATAETAAPAPREATPVEPAPAPAPAISYQDILGDSVIYGVTAGTFAGHGDSQTNVAAKVASCTSQTGNDLTNPSQQVFTIGEIDGTFGVKGDSVYFRTSPGNEGKIVWKGGTAQQHVVDTSHSAKQLQAEVQALLDHARAQQASLASQAQNAQPTLGADQKYHLDLAGHGAGTYYVTLDATAYAQVMDQADRLQIRLDEDQSVVFNVTAPGTLAMHKFSVNGRGSDAYLGSDAGSLPQRIVWNFASASAVTTRGSVTGIVLAPQASFSNEATSSGWLVAASVTIGSGEWHNVHQGQTQTEGGSASLSASKLVDGSPAGVSGFTFKVEERVADGWAQVGDAVANEGSQVAFAPMAYGEAGFSPDQAGGNRQTHVYRISEEAGPVTLGGTTYDTDATTFFARVVVHRFVDTRGGTTVVSFVAEQPAYFADEECTVPAEGGATFRNVTRGEETTSVSVRKAWRTSAGNVPWPRGARVEVALLADGRQVDAVTLTAEAPTHTFEGLPKGPAYTVRELAVEAEGWGDHSVSVTGSAEDGFTVTNIRRETQGHNRARAVLRATKAYDGWKEGQGFELELVARTDGAPLPGSTTATVTQDQPQASFVLAFTQEGTYEYAIREVLPKGVSAESPCKDGVTYDTAEHTATVTVVADQDGELHASVAYEEGGAEGVVVTNSYRASATGFAVEGTKTLDGRAPAAGAYEFQLVDDKGAVVGTATNQADGSFAIATANDLLAQEGTYEYELSEVGGGQTLGGVAYDGHVAKVAVAVTDDGRGQLVASVEVEEGATAFANTTVGETGEPEGPGAPDEPEGPGVTDVAPDVGTGASGATAFGGGLPKTGDPTSLASLCALVVAGLALVAVALRQSRHRRN